MLKMLGARERRPELMDDWTQGGPELREALAHLRRLNWLFGAAGPTFYGVKRLWRSAGCPKDMSIVDIGSGSGDVNRKLLRWASEEGIHLHVTLVDMTAEAVKEASLYYWNEARVQVRQADLYELEPGSADIVTGTQFLHHFSGNEMERAAAHMLRVSRIGVVVNDIHRHWLAWSAVWLAARLLSHNRFIRHDGPLSVAKGFRAEDWEKLRQSPGMARLRYSWRPLFRYAVTIPKDSE